MSSSDDTHRPAAEKARALLAVFDIQPPPDFAAQILARVHARQSSRERHEAQCIRPLERLQPSLEWIRERRHICPRFQTLMQVAGALCLLIMSITLPWWWCTRRPAVSLPQEQSTARLPTIGDPTSVSSLEALPRQALLASPAPSPHLIDLTTQSGEEKSFDWGALSSVTEGQERPAALPEAIPQTHVREAKKTSPHMQNLRSGRQRGVPGKAKRPWKGMGSSKHAPA